MFRVVVKTTGFLFVFGWLGFGVFFFFGLVFSPLRALLHCVEVIGALSTPICSVQLRLPPPASLGGIIEQQSLQNSLMVEVMQKILSFVIIIQYSKPVTL